VRSRPAYPRAPARQDPRAPAAVAGRRRWPRPPLRSSEPSSRARCSCPYSARGVRALRADRLGESLGAQVRGADRVRLVDDRGAAGLVPPHRQGEAEGEDEPDQAKECGLQNADRLPEMLGPVPQVAPEHEADRHCAEDDRQQDERELPAREAKEHAPTLVSGGCARNDPSFAGVVSGRAGYPSRPCQ
jgi:hypothetical protein